MVCLDFVIKFNTKMIKKFLFIYLFLFSFFLTNSYSDNNTYMSLKNKKVNVRYGPGLDYPIKFVFNKKNYPVEIIDEKENFRKILDFKKNSGWIHRSQLKKSSSFITLDTVILFSDSTKFSRPIAKIESGRLLNKKKCNLNWCRVETGEYKGWVLKENLWGLN